MIGHILWEMFNWPSGNILGNLLASIIAFGAGFIAGRKWLKGEFGKLHDRLTEHHDLLKKVHEKL